MLIKKTIGSVIRIVTGSTGVYLNTLFSKSNDEIVSAVRVINGIITPGHENFIAVGISFIDNHGKCLN